jgi:hypothetical protein
LSSHPVFLLSALAWDVKAAAIVPAAGSTAKIGPDYNGVLISFVHNFWQLKEASKICPSLNQAFNAIKAFRPVWTK